MIKQEQLEKNIRTFMLNQSGEFNLQDLMQALPGKQAPQKQELIDILREDPFVFSKDDETYLPRHVYFKDARFLISPRTEELEQGILIPGHRLLPFYASDLVLPWDCTLVTPEQVEVKRKTVYESLGFLDIYYTLFGPEQVIKLLIVDQNANETLLNTGGYNRETELAVTAFDFTGLYRQWKCEPGDSLLFEVEDWLKGSFAISYVSKERRQELMVSSAEWIGKLEQSFQQVFDTSGFRQPIAEQMAYAYYYAGKDILQDPPIHFGGFLDTAKKVYLIPFGIEARLWRNREINTTELMELVDREPPKKQEGLNGMLESLGLPCTEVDVEAFMRDELFRHKGILTSTEDYFDPIIERLLGKDARFFSDIQRTTLCKYFSKLWKKVAGSYNFFKDQASGKVRARLLDILERYFAWLRDLSEQAVDPADIPVQIMAGLSQSMIALTGFLELLNIHDGVSQAEIKGLYDMLPKIDKTMESFKEKALEHTHKTTPFPGGSHLRLVRPGDMDDEEEEVEAENIFVLRLSIKGITPQIWRSVQVPGSFTLGDLHQVIQMAMGWDDEHLHCFEIKGVSYGPISDEDFGFDDMDQEDEDDYTLDELNLAPKQRFSYTYDFGDDWEHQILVSKILPAASVSDVDQRFPRCLSGKRACPPENCGGIWGYEEALEALKTPKKKKNRELLEWLEDFEPEYFDVDEVNSLFRSNDLNDDDDDDVF